MSFKLCTPVDREAEGYSLAGGTEQTKRLCPAQIGPAALPARLQRDF